MKYKNGTLLNIKRYYPKYHMIVKILGYNSLTEKSNCYVIKDKGNDQRDWTNSERDINLDVYDCTVINNEEELLAVII